MPHNRFFANCSPGLIVVRRELVEELLDAVLLPHRVDVRHFVHGQRREVEVHLQKGEMINDSLDNSVIALTSHDRTDEDGHSLYRVTHQVVFHYPSFRHGQ